MDRRHRIVATRGNGRGSHPFGTAGNGGTPEHEDGAALLRRLRAVSADRLIGRLGMSKAVWDLIEILLRGEPGRASVYAGGDAAAARRPRGVRVRRRERAA